MSFPKNQPGQYRIPRPWVVLANSITLCLIGQTVISAKARGWSIGRRRNRYMEIVLFLYESLVTLFAVFTK